MRIRDVALKTCQRRWTIGRSGERWSGISVTAARHDDDSLISFFSFSLSLLVYFKNGSLYLTRGTGQVFIRLMCFKVWFQIAFFAFLGILFFLIFFYLCLMVCFQYFCVLVIFFFFFPNFWRFPDLRLLLIPLFFLSPLAIWAEGIFNPILHPSTLALCTVNWYSLF